MLELIPESDLVLLDGLLHVLELLVVVLSIHDLHIRVVQVVLVGLLLIILGPSHLVLPGRAYLRVALVGLRLLWLVIHRELFESQLLLAMARLVDMTRLELFVA